MYILCKQYCAGNVACGLLHQSGREKTFSKHVSFGIRLVDIHNEHTVSGYHCDLDWSLDHEGERPSEGESCREEVNKGEKGVEMA